MKDAQEASNVRMLPRDGQIEGSEDYQYIDPLSCRLLRGARCTLVGKGLAWKLIGCASVMGAP